MSCVTVPIGGTLDHPVVEWDVMRGESAELIGLVRGKLANESPGTAAAVGAIEGLADGKLDDTLAAGFELIKELRDRRRAAKEGAATQPVGEAPAVPKKPVRDAVREFLRGKSDAP